MRLLPFFLLGFLSSTAFAMGFLEFRSEGFDPATVKNKKWQLGMGLDYLQYPTTLPEFEGAHETIEENQNYNVFGINLGLGREFGLFGDFSTTIRVGGFYAKTLNKTKGKASEDIDQYWAVTRSDHMIYGGEGSIALNYLIENKVLNVQPFVEFSVGSGKSDVEVEYMFEGLQPDGSDAEDYDISVQEDFSYSKASVGFNFISYQGVLSYIKVSQMFLQAESRDTSGFDGNNEIKTKDENPKQKSLLAASVGFAYLF